MAAVSGRAGCKFPTALARVLRRILRELMTASHCRLSLNRAFGVEAAGGMITDVVPLGTTLAMTTMAIRRQRKLDQPLPERGAFAKNRVAAMPAPRHSA